MQRTHGILLLIVLCVAVSIRTVLLEQSFWLDEAAQAIESMRPLGEQLNIAADFQPPLYHLVVYLFARVGSDEWWLRLASVIPGVFSILLTYLIGKEVFGKKGGVLVGTLAAAFLAFSSFHVYYSQELRPYMFAGFWGTLSWFFLLKMEKRQASAKYAVLYGLSTVGGLYSMYVYPFLWVSQVAYVLFRKKNIVRYMKIWAVSAAAFIPWVPSFLEQFSIGNALRSTLPGWQDVVSTPQWKSLPLIFLKFTSGVVAFGHSPMAKIYAVLGAVFVILVLKFITADLFYRKPAKKQLFPLFIWLVVSLGSAWLVSFAVPVLSPKRAVFAQPAFFLLLAYGLQRMPAVLRNALAALFLTYLLVGVGWYWTEPLFQRERWKEAITYINDSFPHKNTVAVFGFDQPFAPWLFYGKKLGMTMPAVSLEKRVVDDPQAFEAGMQQVLPYDNILLFDYLRDLTDSKRKMEEWLEDHGYMGVKSIDTGNFGFIRYYQRGKSFAYRVE